MKTSNMKAFEGVDFDCDCRLPKLHEVHESTWIIHGPLIKGDLNSKLFSYRPRLNKAQVLPSWGWVADGFIWMVKYKHLSKLPTKCHVIHRSSELLRLMDKDPYYEIHWTSCVGLDEGYELEGMEVYKEVVK